MIRTTCPHCQLVQEFPDGRAGSEVTCEWCGEPQTVGGPGAEYLPDDEPGDRPAREPLPAGRVIGSLLVTAAALLGLFALVGLPVLDFGYGLRFGTARPINAFWLVLLVAAGLQWVGERLRGNATSGATGV